MGTMFIRVSRCNCVPRKASSIFLQFAENLNSKTNYIPRKIRCLSSGGSTLVFNQIKENKRDIPNRVVTGHVIDKYFTSTTLKSTSEPLNPLEGNVPNVCWNCEADLGKAGNNELYNLLTCSNCNALRILPKELNYFELFGMQRKFQMDLKKLAQKYKSMQRILHPDR